MNISNAILEYFQDSINIDAFDLNSLKPKLLKEAKELIRQFKVKDFINNKTYDFNCFYDSKTEKYCYIDSNGDVEYWTSEKTLKRELRRIYGFFSDKELKELIREIPTYKSVFNPQSFETIIKNETTGREYFNVFQPSEILAYEPKPEDRIDKVDLSKYKAISLLLKNLFREEDRIDWFLNWLSAVLNERRKLGIVPVVIGVQGAGKNLFINTVIKKAYSDKYLIELSNEHLKSIFNGFLRNKLFLVLNEVKGDFRDSNTIYDKLKNWITEEELTINEKHLRAIKEKTYFNLIIFSNHTLPVQIEPSDRRYVVFKTSDKKLSELVKEQGYKDIYEFIEHIEKEAYEFLIDVKSLRYDIVKVQEGLYTEEKEMITERTSRKIEILASKLKEGDWSWFEDREYIFTKRSKEISNYYTNKDIERMWKDFKKEFQEGYISNETAEYLYRMYVSADENYNKIMLEWSGVLGKAERRRIGNERKRIRYFRDYKNISLLNNFLSKYGDMIKKYEKEGNGKLGIYLLGYKINKINDIYKLANELSTEVFSLLIKEFEELLKSLNQKD